MMMKVLEGFHNSISRRNVGVTAQRDNDGGWEWDLMEVALQAIGVWPMMEYVWRRQATSADYVAGRPIYKLCTGSERMEGSIRFMWWWDQEHTPTQAEREVG